MSTMEQPAADPAVMNTGMCNICYENVIDREGPSSSFALRDGPTWIKCAHCTVVVHLKCYLEWARHKYGTSGVDNLPGLNQGNVPCLISGHSMCDEAHAIVYKRTTRTIWRMQPSYLWVATLHILCLLLFYIEPLHFIITRLGDAVLADNPEEAYVIALDNLFETANTHLYAFYIGNTWSHASLLFILVYYALTIYATRRECQEELRDKYARIADFERTHTLYVAEIGRKYGFAAVRLYFIFEQLLYETVAGEGFSTQSLAWYIAIPIHTLAITCRVLFIVMAATALGSWLRFHTWVPLLPWRGQAENVEEEDVAGLIMRIFYRQTAVAVVVGSAYIGLGLRNIRLFDNLLWVISVGSALGHVVRNTAYAFCAFYIQDDLKYIDRSLTSLSANKRWK